MKLPRLCPRSSKCKVWQRCGCQRRLTSLHWVLTANLPDGELYRSRDGEIPRLTCLNATQNREPADSTHRWEALLHPLLRRLWDKKPKKLFVLVKQQKMINCSTKLSPLLWVKVSGISAVQEVFTIFKPPCQPVDLFFWSERLTGLDFSLELKRHRPASSALSSGRMTPAVQREILWYWSV